MKLYILAIACLLVVGLAPLAASGQNYKTIDGHDFSVSLKADKPTIMLGETTFLSFEVKNHSKARLSFGDGGDYRNNIGRPDSYQVTVVRDDGKAVPQPKVTFWMGGLYGGQYVPVNGSYVRKLFVPHWAIFEEPGTYKVTVTRTLGIAGTDHPSFRWPMAGETPSITTNATTTLTVAKTDNDRLGAVIRDTGTKMLTESDREGARDDLQLLQFIKDPRTIEYWIKAVDIYSKDRNANGFHRYAQTPRILATYDTPEAWAALKSAMKSKSDDVRLDVADAFSSSNNAQALPLLLSMQEDPYWLVRLRVAQRLDKENNAAATEVLLKLLNDQNQDVWESAERALKKRNEMPDIPLRPLSALTCSVRQVQAVRTLQSLGGNNPGTAGSGGVFLGGENCESSLNAFIAELSERRTKNDMLGEAWVLYQIGDIYRDSRRYEQARDNYALALPLFRTLENVAAQSEILSELAGVSESLNKPADAVSYLDQELALVRSSSNETVREDEGRILERIASAYFMLGDDAKGIDFLVKRLDWEIDQKSESGQFLALRELGKGYERIGKKAEARASYERALIFSKVFTGFQVNWLEDQITELKADIQRLK